jgi:Skp family chaperone for outer membrane proteins
MVGRLTGRPWLWPGVLVVAAYLALQSVALAQEPASSILTLDQERLFLESEFGKAAIERERVASQALEQENRRIESELVAEEQALTEARATLSAEEFTARADAFDAKVERIRTEQDAKAGRLTEGREVERKAFLEVAVPILGEILGDRGATAILDKGQVILSLSAIDVTDEAIARVNEATAKKPEPTP